MHNFLTAVHPDVDVKEKVNIMYYLENELLIIGKQHEFEAVITANAGSVTKDFAEYILKYDINDKEYPYNYREKNGCQVFEHATLNDTIVVSVKYLAK
ncbi:unnamed protein product [Didymodactylos carnosus]|uniref:Uncharacterized protein n=1 Tax=Didymodactylos carnosus TaxID=1234261 RepID=A0A815WZ67_9BILA|nr:unnamed protein product [Didymodactylos carnosus]CAF4413463.1 unnamed protein product [Didymodactylos carnosus]